MNEHELLCTKEAARFLRISHRTMENWRQQGTGPKYYRLNKKLVRYNKKDLIDFDDPSSLQ